MKMLETKFVWYLARGSIIDSGWHSIGSLVQISVRDIVYDLVRTEVRNSVRSSVLTLVKSFTKESTNETP